MNKICLINPPTTGEAAKEVYFPMALICLASALQEAAVPTEIVDFDLDSKRDPRLAQWTFFKAHALNKLEASESQIFGISSICSNFPIALLLAKEIRSKWPSARIVLGGPQPSATPIDILTICPWVDVIAIGEGEVTILELMQSDWTRDSLRKISGIAFIDDGQPILTDKRPLMKELDNLPFPDFTLVPINDYLDIAPGTALIEAGRGCPFLCSFCSTSLMWERNFRIKSPSRILDEMKRLSQAYGLKSFALTHDNFTTSHKYVSEFCDFFEYHNEEGFIWSSSARPDTLNTERIAALYNAGCRGLFLGVDAGSQRTQKEITKNLDIDYFRSMLKAASSYKMEITTSFILGFYREHDTDLNQTISLALESRLQGATSAQIHRLSPLSGTRVYEENKTNLTLDAGPTDLSLLPIMNDDLIDIVRQYPHLFCSFYSVPNPNLKDLNVSALAVFYNETINRIPSVLKKLFQATNWSPTLLFRYWWGWRATEHSDRVIEGQFIINTFDGFIRWCSHQLATIYAHSGTTQTAL